MASIIFMNGQRKGEFFPVGKRTLVVGRAESLPLQILDDQVSRKHLQIRYDELNDQHFACDLGSKNGVLINGEKIATDTLLMEGHYVQIGDTLLLYTVEDFKNPEAALHHFHKVGEHMRPTIFEDRKHF